MGPEALRPRLDPASLKLHRAAAGLLVSVTVFFSYCDESVALDEKVTKDNFRKK